MRHHMRSRWGPEQHPALLQARRAGLCNALIPDPVRGRAEEEAQREAEVKAIEALRYEREMEMARQEAEEEKARRKEAYARCGAAGGVLVREQGRSRLIHVSHLRVLCHRQLQSHSMVWSIRKSMRAADSPR